jgi:antitoxin (DNA-binding transcriptional repressor) of toxin-antitoxin stability system
VKGRPSGYEWVVRGKEVVISHHGRVAAVLRGEKARNFVQEAETSDAQLLMARLTGNYKRGNERTGKSHPRNR